jgi:hypothetical protein
MFLGVLIEGCFPKGFLFAADAVVLMNIEVLTKYPLSHNDGIVVLKIRLHRESPMLYRPALHGN